MKLLSSVDSEPPYKYYAKANATLALLSLINQQIGKLVNWHIDQLTYFSKIIISTLLLAAACSSVASGIANFGFETPNPFTFIRRSKM